MKKDTVLEAFTKLWSELFSSPVHLDSLLSKQPKNLKSALARMVAPILLRPVSEAESFGIGVNPGEPWSLGLERLSQWRTAALLADRIYGSLSNPPQPAAPMRDDFPSAMFEEWVSDWGGEVAGQLVAVLGREAPLSLRAARGWGPEKLVRELKSASTIPVKIEKSDLSPVGVRLGGYAQLFGIQAYEQGAFEIQDEGSQVMALFSLWPEIFGASLSSTPGPASALSLKMPDEAPVLQVVDACAGAGGKSLALADFLRGKGRVFAYDVSVSKLQALRKRATRAGVNNIQTLVLKQGQESEQLGKFRETADLVLVDAPCSGWGVLRRNPDIKWRQERAQLERMPSIQLRLLSEYAQLVKPGGRLVFGVCTFRKAETLNVVLRFLEENPGFSAGPGGYFGPGPSDGFFMQSFGRKR